MARVRLALSVRPLPWFLSGRGPAPVPTLPSVPKRPDLSVLEHGLPKPLPAEAQQVSAHFIPCPGSGGSWAVVGTYTVGHSTSCTNLTVSPGQVPKPVGFGTITITTSASFVVSGRVRGKRHFWQAAHGHRPGTSLHGGEPPGL